MEPLRHGHQSSAHGCCQQRQDPSWPWEGGEHQQRDQSIRRQSWWTDPKGTWTRWGTLWPGEPSPWQCLERVMGLFADGDKCRNLVPLMLMWLCWSPRAAHPWPHWGDKFIAFSSKCHQSRRCCVRFYCHYLSTRNHSFYLPHFKVLNLFPVLLEKEAKFTSQSLLCLHPLLTIVPRKL